MASALIKGLLMSGTSTENVLVIEPNEEARRLLVHQFSLTCLPTLTPKHALQENSFVVWAVKPQQMKEACQSLADLTINAVHLSVAAGIPCASLSSWLKTKRIIRAMPNTPALIGMGQTALFAQPSISSQERLFVQHIIQGTGQSLWLDDESLLDAVTAISGSGPAYVFYFLEALCKVGKEMGLSADHARQLAIGTFVGSSHLAQQSDESLTTLREKVTSKGGTTEAALNQLNADGVSNLFEHAIKMAKIKSTELGQIYGN